MPSKRNVERLGKLEQMLQAAEGSFYLVNYQGLSAVMEHQLRKNLREQGGSLFVTKNTLLRIAMEKVGLPDPGGLAGPSGVVFFGDPVAVAKALAEFADKSGIGIPKAKVGFLSGQLLGGSSIELLAKLPGMQELRSELVGVLSAPMQELVGVLGGVSRELVGVLDAYAQKRDAA